MPTGYTADIAKGITFKEYALTCARGMGALIMMRDEPFDAPIPDKFEPSDCHEKALEKALSNLQDFNLLDVPALTDLYEKENIEVSTGTIERNQRNDELKAKYEAMLLECEAYEPPTAEHVGFKNFMIQQIQESIKWDCRNYEEKEKPLFEEWLAEKKKSLDWDISYHSKELREEIRRTNERNKWISELKQSLNA